MNIYLAGERGLLGTCIKKRLIEQEIDHVSTNSHDLDLRDESSVHSYFEKHRPSHTILCAAKTGGLFSNQRSPLDFIEDNLKIQFNVFKAAHSTNCKKVTFVASSTIYPESAIQPYKEEALFTGKLHSSIASYAHAKLMGIHAAKIYNEQLDMDIRCVIPCNLYGPSDKFDAENKHVIPALIDKFIQAKELGLSSVYLPGTGRARREFLYAEDAARFIVDTNLDLNKEKWVDRADPEYFSMNLGYMNDIEISELAKEISDLVGYDGKILFNIDQNDGALTKKVDASRAFSLGWQANTTLQLGLRKTLEARLKGNQ